MLFLLKLQIFIFKHKNLPNFIITIKNIKYFSVTFIKITNIYFKNKKIYLTLKIDENIYFKFEFV